MAGVLPVRLRQRIVPLTDCLGDAFCETAMKGMRDEVQRLMSGSGREVNQGFLMGKNGWNEYQGGVLDKIPVVLIGGKKFTKFGQANPAVWPNDGLVALQSALARTSATRCSRTGAATPSTTPTASSCPTWRGWTGKTALTWDPQVLETVHNAIQNAPNALDGPNREGCPAK